MNASASEVEAGVIRANSAGVVLENILVAADSLMKMAEQLLQVVSRFNLKG